MIVRLRDLNEHLTCGLCKGYLVSATLVIECLHAFCKSCIVQHVEQRTQCPTCNILIHESQPLNYIRGDPTLQEIVNKLIPSLQQSEQKREDKFYWRRGFYRQLTGRKRALSGTDDQTVHPGKELNFHRDDDQIYVCLNHCSSGKAGEDSMLRPLKKKYVRCSHHATVRHLKKLVRRKLNLSDSYKIDITCNEQLLGTEHTLQFVALTSWRYKPEPLALEFKCGGERDCN